jgi:hypothetical protein
MFVDNAAAKILIGKNSEKTNKIINEKKKYNTPL